MNSLFQASLILWRESISRSKASMLLRLLIEVIYQDMLIPRGQFFRQLLLFVFHIIHCLQFFNKGVNVPESKLSLFPISVTSSHRTERKKLRAIQTQLIQRALNKLNKQSGAGIK